MERVLEYFVSLDFSADTSLWSKCTLSHCNVCAYVRSPETFKHLLLFGPGVSISSPLLLIITFIVIYFIPENGMCIHHSLLHLYK